jgi:DNA-binding GntR family transcriptional regulator
MQRRKVRSADREAGGEPINAGTPPELVAEPALDGAVLDGAERVAEGLRHRIQTSEILPGEWLRESRLCQEFGVGRSIARRALRILEEDGLLELEEHRGARVAATSVQEVFDLFEVRAALYGLAARFTCLRGSATSVARMLVMIDQLLLDAENGAKASDVIDLSEAIFSEMATTSSPDARKMIESIRRKTRWHYSYAALDESAGGSGPFEYWRTVRSALIARDADAASEAARGILYFMQHEVSRIMLSRGARTLSEAPPVARPVKRKPKSGG